MNVKVAQLKVILKIARCSNLKLSTHITGELFVPRRKAIQFSRNGNGTDLEQVVHTHRKSCRNGWPSGFGELNPSPHSWIFSSVLVDFSPCSYLFTSAPRLFSFSSMAAAVIIGKREDPGDEVGNRKVPESSFFLRVSQIPRAQE